MVKVNNGESTSMDNIWYIWENYNDLTATEPWNHGFYREIIPKWP